MTRVSMTIREGLVSVDFELEGRQKWVDKKLPAMLAAIGGAIKAKVGT